jgi:2-isopropylmalate synthase
MSPESVGIPKSKMVLGKHSGRHALEERLKDMGYSLPRETIDRIAEEFKKLADQKKAIDDRDLEALVEPHLDNNIRQSYVFDRFVVNSGNSISATAIVRLMHNGEPAEEVSSGDGPIDAAFKAIDKIVGKSFTLEVFRIHSATEGQDALGVAEIRLSYEGRQERGRGASTDIIEACVKAYLSAVNRFISE